MKFKPTMTLRFGANHNSLTLHEESGETVFDFNKMHRDRKAQIKRMTVEAWCKVNGIRNNTRTKRYRYSSPNSV
jgi:hypothetical protein